MWRSPSGANTTTCRADPEGTAGARTDGGNGRIGIGCRHRVSKVCGALRERPAINAGRPRTSAPRTDSLGPRPQGGGLPDSRTRPSRAGNDCNAYSLQRSWPSGGPSGASSGHRAGPHPQLREPTRHHQPPRFPGPSAGIACAHEVAPCSKQWRARCTPGVDTRRLALKGAARDPAAGFLPARGLRLARPVHLSYDRVREIGELKHLDHLTKGVLAEYEE